MGSSEFGAEPRPSHPQRRVAVMSRSAYRSSSNVVYSAKYHLVWCPKYRRRVLVGAVETRLVEIIRQVCEIGRASWRERL